MTKKYSYTYNIYVYVFMYTQAVYCDSSCLYLYTGEHQVLSHLVIFNKNNYHSISYRHSFLLHGYCVLFCMQNMTNMIRFICLYTNTEILCAALSESFSYNYPKVRLTCGECQRCVGLGTHTGVELNHCCIQPLKTKFTYQHERSDKDYIT